MPSGILQADVIGVKNDMACPDKALVIKIDSRMNGNRVGINDETQSEIPSEAPNSAVFPSKISIIIAAAAPNAISRFCLPKVITSKNPMHGWKT